MTSQAARHPRLGSRYVPVYVAEVADNEDVDALEQHHYSAASHIDAGRQGAGHCSKVSGSLFIPALERGALLICGTRDCIRNQLKGKAERTAPNRGSGGVCSFNRSQGMADIMITLHKGDLPEGLTFGGSVAIDSETLGLRPHRDRLCLVQLSAGDGTAHLVQFDGRDYGAPRLRALLADPSVLKIFHFARFDLAVMSEYLGTMATPVYCTKIASKLVRTYTDRHGLKDVVSELAGVELSKQKQSSDWGADNLSEEQLAYAANDVLHLHVVKQRLDEMLAREGRTHLAQAAFDFLPIQAELDLAGFGDMDIFSH
jgi:ribonuclease D